MKILEPGLYAKAKRNTLSLGDAKSFLQFEPDPDREQSMSWEECWWTYLLADELPDHLKEWGRELRFTYNINDRRTLVAYTANDIIDRLLPR